MKFEDLKVGEKFECYGDACLNYDYPKICKCKKTGPDSAEEIDGISFLISPGAEIIGKLEEPEMQNFGQECAHERFKAQCNVTRLTEGDSGPVTGYRADLEINCTQCGKQFIFPGVPGGYTPSHPTVNVDQTELRIPIKPII